MAEVKLSELKSKFIENADGSVSVRADKLIDKDGNPVSVGAGGGGGLAVTEKDGEILVHPSTYKV